MAVPIGLRFSAPATDGVITLLVAPVSHNAVVVAVGVKGLGGDYGSNASVMLTSVTIRLVIPSCFLVKAWNDGIIF